MIVNAITISSRLEAAGLEKKTADTVASEIVDFNGGQSATKADVAEFKGELKADTARLETKLNVVIALNVGLMIAFMVDKIVG